MKNILIKDMTKGFPVEDVMHGEWPFHPSFNLLKLGGPVNATGVISMYIQEKVERVKT